MAAAAVVTLVLLAFSWPTVTATARDLPIAVVGSQKQIDQITSQAPTGLLIVRKTDNRDSAVAAIRHREVYGAVIVADRSPEVLLSSAASPAVANQLRTMAANLQINIDNQAIQALQGQIVQFRLGEESQADTFADDSAGDPSDSSAQQPELTSSQTPQVAVTDIAPFNSNDSTGAGIAISGLPLTIGGIVGGVFISLSIRSRRVRAFAVGVYGVVGGLALASVMQGWFGILQGNFALNALAAGLAIASTAAIINGFASLVGSPGIAIGAVLTMFIGNPISSLNQPKEFLAWHWGDIGQFFVPGASGTLLRDLSYFPDAPMTANWWTLIAWTAGGFALILLGHLRAHSSRRSAQDVDESAGSSAHNRVDSIAPSTSESTSVHGEPPHRTSLSYLLTKALSQATSRARSSSHDDDNRWVNAQTPCAVVKV